MVNDVKFDNHNFQILVDQGVAPNLLVVELTTITFLIVFIYFNSPPSRT